VDEWDKHHKLDLGHHRQSRLRVAKETSRCIVAGVGSLNLNVNISHCWRFVVCYLWRTDRLFAAWL